MRPYDLILMVVSEEPRSTLVGRTLLQKKIYFLNELLHGSVSFSPHNYGPFSAQVARAVDSLVAAGILDEEAEKVTPVETPWGESTRYQYVVRDKQKISEIIRKNAPGEYDTASSCLKKLNARPEARDYKTLSIAAKVHQILRLKKKLRINEFPKEADKLGWKLKKPDIDRAVKFLSSLGMLSLSKS
jgi:uncharacterized protein YwgA